MKQDGLLVLNHDDEKVYALHQKAQRRAVSYGLHENATYRASYASYVYVDKNGVEVPNGISFKLEYAGNTFPVILHHMIGTHYVGQALAALACACEIGCNILESIKAVEGYTTPQGRLSLH
jgi:UDP-N-acetylmuramyl tripeptide synthase